MEIKSHKNLAPRDARNAEMAELKKAKKESEFRLRLDANGQIDKDALNRLLLVVRASKSYKKHFEDFQFKVKSDSRGQFLSLKRQGLWSSFKGLFGIGREQRERQRDHAAGLINAALGHKTFDSGEDTKRMTFATAKEYQLATMMRRGFVPPGMEPTHTLRSGQNADSSNSLSGPLTFEGLVDRQDAFIDEQSSPHKSYQEIDADAGPGMIQPGQRENSPPVGKPGNHNSYQLASQIDDDNDAYDTGNHESDQVHNNRSLAAEDDVHAASSNLIAQYTAALFKPKA